MRLNFLIALITVFTFSEVALASQKRCKGEIYSVAGQTGQVKFLSPELAQKKVTVTFIHTGNSRGLFSEAVSENCRNYDYMTFDSDGIFQVPNLVKSKSRKVAINPLAADFKGKRSINLIF